jgi:isopentenyl phosphate kinase
MGLMCENDLMSELVFLKLGGSLITDKTVPFTPRKDKIASLAGIIARTLQSRLDLSLVLGHGSGSFGHTAAEKHGTRQGVKSPEQWAGFAEVWYQAATLNRYVMDALNSAGIKAVALAPISSITARDGRIIRWDLDPLRRALAAKILPVIYGDVVFDEIRGGTILSTEDLFGYLASELQPKNILLAGLEEGVWADFPDRKLVVDRITPESFSSIKQGVGAGLGVDVTGGMQSKVGQMLEVVKASPMLKVLIFSGEDPEKLQKALNGEKIGTMISVT